jgi:uncharacterized protein
MKSGDTEDRSYYLPEGLPVPVPAEDLVDAQFWDGLREEHLFVQECSSCGNRQFPEWICHECHSFELGWVAIAPRGTLFSWARVWRGAHPVVEESIPYLIALVQLSEAPKVRLVGNLLGPSEQPVRLDVAVHGVFEHHATYSLLQWRLEESVSDL